MRFLPAVLLLALAAGCSDATTGTGSAREPSSSAAPTGTPTGPGARPGRPSSGDPADSPACAEVRAGIAAFNTGDFAGTVAHFEKAVPLARARLDGSRAADDLLEAVRWYAALPPQDYPAASATSPAFVRYKAITLGQCAGHGAPASTGAPGERI